MKFCIIFVTTVFFFTILCSVEPVDSSTIGQPYTAVPEKPDISVKEHSENLVFRLSGPSALKQSSSSKAEQLDDSEILQFHRHLIGRLKCRCPEEFVLLVDTCVSCAKYVNITEEDCPVCKN